jgi:hypothetical protein
MDSTCIKKVIMQNPWNPGLLLKVPKQLPFAVFEIFVVREE